MSVKVRWRELGEIGEDEGWQYLRCLYAYTTTNANEILYIGKAERNSIYQRWKAPDKQKLWLALQNQRQIYEHRVWAGDLELEAGRKFSWQLLSDIESLLIACEQSWGNVQCRNTRISRLNLEVKCLGNWIGSKFLFRKKHDSALEVKRFEELNANKICSIFSFDSRERRLINSCNEIA